MVFCKSLENLKIFLRRILKSILLHLRTMLNVNKMAHIQQSKCIKYLARYTVTLLSMRSSDKWNPL